MGDPRFMWDGTEWAPLGGGGGAGYMGVWDRASSYPAGALVNWRGRLWGSQSGAVIGDEPGAGYSPPPENIPAGSDMLADAPLVTAGFAVSPLQSNVGMTLESGEVTLNGTHCFRSAWWRFRAPATAAYVIHTGLSDDDTFLTVNTGSVPNPTIADLTRLGADDDSFGDYKSKLTFSGTAGTDYFICVGSWSDSTMSYSLSISTTVPNYVGAWRQTEKRLYGHGRWETLTGLGNIAPDTFPADATGKIWTTTKTGTGYGWPQKFVCMSHIDADMHDHAPEWWMIRPASPFLTRLTDAFGDAGYDFEKAIDVQEYANHVAVSVDRYIDLGEESNVSCEVAYRLQDFDEQYYFHFIDQQNYVSDNVGQMACNAGHPFWGNLNLITEFYMTQWDFSGRYWGLWLESLRAGTIISVGPAWFKVTGWPSLVTTDTRTPWDYFKIPVVVYAYRVAGQPSFEPSWPSVQPLIITYIP